MMQINSKQEPSPQLKIYANLNLINVTEVSIFQLVLEDILKNHFEDKHIIEPAAVCALLLNHQNVVNYYATSAKGYRNLCHIFTRDCKENITTKLIPWAINKVKALNQPRTLEQDLVIAQNSQIKQIRTQSWQSIENNKHPKVEEADIFDLLAKLSLTNFTEQEVVKEVYNHIQDLHSQQNPINLSDVCALVLNNSEVPVMYATNAKEYNQSRHKYLSKYQTKVRSIIRRVSKQVSLEGSEHSFSMNNTAKAKANQRNINSWKNP